MIYNAGGFPANRYTTGMTSKTSVDLNLESGEVVILGTEYAGEMKKAVFTYMNYRMPKDDDSLDALFGDRRSRRPIAPRSCSACRALARRPSRPIRIAC